MGRHDPLWCFFVLIGSGKITLPEGVRYLTDDEKRWLAIGHGKDKNYECQWDTEADLMVQTNIPIPKVLY